MQPMFPGMEFAERAPVKGFGRFILDFIDDIGSERLPCEKAYAVAEYLAAEIDTLTSHYDSGSPEGTETLRRHMLQALDLLGESLSEVLLILGRKSPDTWELEGARKMVLKASSIIEEIENISGEALLKDGPSDE